MLLRSLIGQRRPGYWYSEPALTCWVACSLQRTANSLDAMAALRSSSRSKTSRSWSRCGAELDHADDTLDHPIRSSHVVL